MKENTFGFVCVLLAGVGQMLLFTGYESSSFIVEPVLHSVSEREPERIDANAGYYGLAVYNVVYTFANLFAPWLHAKIGTKTSMVLGSAGFTIYLASFLYVYKVLYYGGAVIMGIGYALYYTGKGAYLMEHSTLRTFERNSAVAWALGSFGMVSGGTILYLTTRTSAAAVRYFFRVTATHAPDSDYREYPDAEIRWTFGAFAAVALCSNFMQMFIPARPVRNSLVEIYKYQKKRTTLPHQLKEILEALLKPRMLLLTPVFALVGSTTSFYITVYPTTFSFTKQLTEYAYLPAYYAVSVGAGDIIMGVFIFLGCKYFNSFGQLPSQALGVLFQMTAMVLVLLSTPFHATAEPTEESSLLIEPNVPLCLVVGFLFGLADNCLGTSRTCLGAVALPEERSKVYAISKFYQSLVSSVFFFLSPLMTLPVYFVIIAVNCSLSLALFFVVRRATKDEEEAALIEIDKMEAKEDSIY